MATPKTLEQLASEYETFKANFFKQQGFSGDQVTGSAETGYTDAVPPQLTLAAQKAFAQSIGLPEYQRMIEMAYQAGTGRTSSKVMSVLGPLIAAAPLVVGAVGAIAGAAGAGGEMATGGFTGAGTVGNAAMDAAMIDMGGGAFSSGLAPVAAPGLFGVAPAAGSLVNAAGATPATPATPAPTVAAPSAAGSSVPSWLKQAAPFIPALGGIAKELITGDDTFKPTSGSPSGTNPDGTPTSGSQSMQSLLAQQALLDQQAFDRSVTANRSNQLDAQGNQLTWTQDPVTKQWTQSAKYGSANQQLFDKSREAQLQALGNVQGMGDFNFQSAPTMGAVGNSADIQKAWMDLLQPQRDQARASEIQRLKNQGLTEDSAAFQRAMQRLDTGDTDAQNKALIAGTSEYGNQYQRSLANRQQAFGEYQTDYNSPLKNYMGLMGVGDTSPAFAMNQQQVGMQTAPDATKTAYLQNSMDQTQYQNQLAADNASKARQDNIWNGFFNLAGQAAKSWGG